MIKVQVRYNHPDGADQLVVVKQPWWTDIAEWLLNRVCPCCGISGRIFNRIPQKMADFWWKHWQDTLLKIVVAEKELFRTPVDGCEASEAIWGDHADICWKDDCPYRNKDDLEGEPSASTP